MIAPRIEVRRGSVTDADVAILVNASNTIGWLGSGVSAAIGKACGPAFQAAITRAMGGRPMRPGDVLVTHAGDHARARTVLHAAVMDYRPGREDERDPDAARLRRCYDGIWDAVERLGTDGWSIGVVALGAGTGGFDLTESTRIACETLRAHVDEGSSQIGRVVFHGFTPIEHAAVLAEVRRHFPIDGGDL